MRALTVIPGTAGTSIVETVAPPTEEQGEVLVRGLLLGVCGTDREIVAGEYGEPPPGEERLVLGHEALGGVVEAPSTCPLNPGDLVVTQDVPLAALLVPKQVAVLDPRGEEHTPETIGERLSIRDFMDQARLAGAVSGGPPPYDARARQRFAAALDRVLTRLQRA